ncbi:MAG: precorrin-6A/cobalt-precorrin-6A reductase, partial [Phascolarctobacterium sp.]|nr:precorrin-6A/cobalt-precorrin-6A reductase [Phascolarctobacterium sp.]
PMESSLQSALELGYKPANIVCMQGPFSKELNVATLKKFNSKFMVTKDSGEVGGFLEKIAAAQEAGAKLIVIGRTTEEQGESYEEILKYLHDNFTD